MSFNEWLTLQDDLIAELEQDQPASIHLNNGTDFDVLPTRVIPTGFTERDLAPGSSIQQGDVKVLISASQFPATITRPLERKDRLEINGDIKGIVHFDPNSRRIQGQTLMYELVVR